MMSEEYRKQWKHNWDIINRVKNKLYKRQYRERKIIRLNQERLQQMLRDGTL